MRFDLETLKNTLMVSLILILVFVLLKRMMAFLKRGQLNEAYAKLLGEGFELQNGVLKIFCYLPKQETITLQVYDERGELILAEEKPALASGEQNIEVNLKNSSLSGKCFFVFKTSNQETTRYFNVS